MAANTEEEDQKQKFVCRLCKTEFDKQKAIVEHLALAHFYQVWEDDRPENGSFYVPSEGPFVCPHCPFTSGARAAFIAHFVHQHEALVIHFGHLFCFQLHTPGGVSNFLKLNRNKISC